MREIERVRTMSEEERGSHLVEQNGFTGFDPLGLTGGASGKTVIS
jgi:hypothetical protein